MARGAHRLARWQRATAIVPLALLSGAWTAALTTGGLATASSELSFGDQPTMPDVPTTPFEVPASVQVSGTGPGLTPTGIDPHAGPQGTLSTLSSNGIPTAAVLAYQRAATVLERADAACQLGWPLVAAIGRVESDHGRYGGNVLAADGLARPGIYGVPLDGSGHTASVRDTDSGAYDHDRVWDRAVGPMQFIPGTWKVVGVDADGDGSKNPQDIDDAALATAVYLCAGDGDLSSDTGARAAVFRYNHSTSYVDLVMSIADAYTNGDYTMVPNDTASPVVLTDVDHDYQQPPPSEDPGAHKPRSPHAGGGGSSDGEPTVDTTGDGVPGGGTGGGNGGGTNGGNDDGGDDGGTGGGTGGTGGDGGTGGGTGGDGGGTGGDGGGAGGGTGGDGGGGGVDDVPEDTQDTTQNTTAPLADATTYCKNKMADAGLSPAEISANLGTCTDTYLEGGKAAADAAIAGIVKVLGDVGGSVPGGLPNSKG